MTFNATSVQIKSFQSQICFPFKSQLLPMYWSKKRWENSLVVPTYLDPFLLLLYNIAYYTWTLRTLYVFVKKCCNQRLLTWIPTDNFTAASQSDTIFGNVYRQLDPVVFFRRNVLPPLWEHINAAWKTFYMYWVLGPLLLTWFNLIPVWISNHIHYHVWDKITYPFLNFNGATVEDWKWIGNFIPHFAGHIITYPCLD